LQAEAARVKQELARHDASRTKVRIDVKIIEVSQAEFDKLGIAKIGTGIEQASGKVAPVALNNPWKTDGKLKGVVFRSLDEKEHATFKKILKTQRHASFRNRRS
jgi:type II secretory pathway component GspD/PulD (secretin)